VIELSTAATRLGLALAFGAFIGIEREWRLKNAGLKTMVLVALGAATFAMMTDTFGAGNHNPGMLAAAVVGGIGFIGAGVIMHRGATVQGVTTAATLWADASVGVAVGLGQFALAAVLTLSILVVQVVMRSFERMILMQRRKTARGRFELRIECAGEAYPAVSELLDRDQDLEVLRRSVQRGPEELKLRAVIRTQRNLNVAALEQQIVSTPGVNKIDVLHLGIEED
jgi:putative Mg2+ transporter-C (MgtC) family protein